MRALAARSEASPMPDPSRRRELIRMWLAKFAVNHNRKMDDESARVMLALWVEGFADIPLQSDAMLEAAFRETLLRCAYFPTIAEVRSHFPAARAEVYGERKADRPALPHGRRGGARGELVGMQSVVDAFRGVARALPAPKPKASAVQTKPVFRFAVDPDHEARVRRQAAEMLAVARP